MNLPASFEEKMQSLLGEEMDAYLACYEEPRYYGLRVNTGKISAEEFRKICPFEITPIPWIENGFYYDGENISPAKHPYYFAGLYYLQEPSAMTPANRLPVEPGDKVLDLCAAPGGKATELGVRLKGEGLLAANDISSSRAKGLLKNIEVFGIGNILVLSEEPGKLESYFTEYFDKILIDAPCSGEGMFRKDKKMVKAWEEHGPEYFCRIQKNIILQAARMLKPGGMLLYSTCTFDSRENESVIGHLKKQYPQFRVLEIAPYEGFRGGMPETMEEPDDETKKTIRIFPHCVKGEGHFLALLQKGGSGEELSEVSEDEGAAGKADRRQISKRESFGKKSGRNIPEAIEDFFRNISWSLDPSRLDIHGERVYYMPEGLPEVRGLRFLRTGLLLGELKKNRFEPSQALAMSLKKEEYACCIDIPAEDERILRYLKGETLDVGALTSAGEKGWRLVCVDGYPLGWGKLSGGLLKNKYLPGWRLCG